MRYWARITIVTALLLSAQQAAASGVQMWLQSANSVGDVGAGAAADVENADVSYYNPAATPWIQRQNMGLSVVSNVNNVKYRGTVTPSPAISGFAGNSGSQGGEDTHIPNLFYVAPLSKKWSVGLAINSPYNNSVDYGSHSPVRYIVSQWYLRTTNITPSVGFRFIRSLAVGVGMDFQYAKVRFYQASPSSTTISGDLMSETNLNDWGYGWNAGLLWQPYTQGHLGLAYHSSISHRSSGSSDIAGGHSHARAIYRLPPMATLSGDLGLGKHFKVLGTVNYTRWSEMGDFWITNMQSATGPTNNQLFSHLSDSWLFSVGTHYLPTTDLTLKAGFGFDQGAVSDSYRTLVLPDGSHYIASIGANYKINKSFNLNLGYSHYFNHDVSVQQSQTNAGTTVVSNGRVSTGSDIFAIQINWLMT